MEEGSVCGVDIGVAVAVAGDMRFVRGDGNKGTACGALAGVLGGFGEGG